MKKAIKKTTLSLLTASMFLCGTACGKTEETEPVTFSQPVISSQKTEIEKQETKPAEETQSNQTINQTKETPSPDYKYFHGVSYVTPIGWDEVLEGFSEDIKIYEPDSEHWGQMELFYQDSNLVVGNNDETELLLECLIGSFSAEDFTEISVQNYNDNNILRAHVEWKDSYKEPFKGDCAIINTENGLMSIFLYCEEAETLYDAQFPIILDRITLDK